MNARFQCPDCGSTKWAEPKYLSNGNMSFMVEGKCISCGFSIDAELLYNLICESTQDLFSGLRLQHDKSLQEETLRDYPLFVNVLKKALELCDTKDEEVIQGINLKLGQIYRELAWYAQTVEETYDYCNLSTKHYVLEDGTIADEEEFGTAFVRLARSKADLDWWVEKRELLREALKIAKEVVYIDDDDHYWAGNAFLNGELSYEYAMALGNDQEAKKVLKEAIEDFKWAISCANQCAPDSMYYDFFFDANFCICCSHEYLGKIYDALSDQRSAYAHYILAEQYASYIGFEILRKSISERIVIARQKLEDKLTGDSIAEAKELARKSLEALEYRSWEKKADESYLKCRDRLLLLHKGLEGKLNKYHYEKLRISLDNLENSFFSVRRLIEAFEREIHGKLIG
jgi:hypothetical protein